MAQPIDLTKIRLEVDRKSRYIFFEDGTEIADDMDSERSNGSDEDEDEDEDGDDEGVKCLRIMIKGGQLTILGFISVYILDRSKLRGKFWMIMDEPMAELASFSTTLFDNKGHLKKTIRGPQKSGQHGTGVFGKEMNTGPIAYLKSINISTKYRRHGKLHNIFCWPVIIDHLERKLPKDRYIVRSDQIIAFFRKLGFRRVGRSKFFAYSFDPSHPSRALTVEDDVGGNPDAREQDPISPEFIAEYPLHHLLIINKNARDAVKVHRLLEAYESDPSSLLKADPLGNNPLHIAACLGNVTLIKGVLALGETATLVTWENAEGQTPVALLQDELEGFNRFAELFAHDREQDAGYQKIQEAANKSGV